MSQLLTVVLLPLEFLEEDNILQLKVSLSSNQGSFYFLFSFWERDINESIVSETNFNEPNSWSDSRKRSQRARQGAAFLLQWWG